MSGYRRFVAYVYEYRKGKKSSNCGYVKVEVRDARCIMDVHLQCAGLTPEIPCKVYGFLRKDGLMNGILLGSCKTQEEAVSCTLETDVRNMGNSGIPLERMGGMIFVTEMGSFFGTEWDDQVIRPENFREIKSEKPSAKKPETKKPETKKTDERKSDVRKPEAPQPEASQPEASQPETLQPEARKPDEKKPDGQCENSTETITQEQAVEREEKPQIQFAEISKESLQARNAEGSQGSLEICQQESTEQFPQVQHAEETKAPHGIQPPETAPERAETADNKMVGGINFKSDPGKKEMTVTEINMSGKEEDTKKQDARNEDTKQQNIKSESAKQKPEWEISSETKTERMKGMQEGTKAESFPRTSPRHPPLPGEKFMPFEDEDFVWCRKIRPEDITCISRRNCALRQNRFVLYGYYNFGHLLLCRRADGKYMFGVPGGYDQQERFMANMFGFPYFKKSRYINLPNDKGGYWYRLIDAPDLN